MKEGTIYFQMTNARGCHSIQVTLQVTYSWILGQYLDTVYFCSMLKCLGQSITFTILQGPI